MKSNFQVKSQSTPPPPMSKKQSNKYLTPFALSPLLASISSVHAAIIHIPLDVVVNIPGGGLPDNTDTVDIIDTGTGNVDDIEVRAHNKDGNNLEFFKISALAGVSLNFFYDIVETEVAAQPILKKFAKDDTISGNENLVGGAFAAVVSDTTAGHSLNELWIGEEAIVEGYIGFKAAINLEEVLYGWIKIAVETDGNSVDSGSFDSIKITLLDGAYENNGGSINAGQIPEASTTATALAILALGAVGMTHRRKRA